MSRQEEHRHWFFGMLIAGWIIICVIAFLVAGCAIPGGGEQEAARWQECYQLCAHTAPGDDVQVRLTCSRFCN